MKKITLAIFMAVMFPSTSFADWSKVGGNDIGDTFYIDFERIKKQNGYVYFWDLTDFLHPQGGALSVQDYKQADCKSFKFIRLHRLAHTEPMAKGSPTPYTPPSKWEHPRLKSVAGALLEIVCK
ncbi:surface-adhesin E family protein [Magnetovibrio blakemorei]|uniref:Surface-adhesin protein E-like domain-containing protein n=1 Tax=Magnetovibrio blakemorei TaxID=28181 RepID=A0A1E5Q352_9PROT|nr:surface-adhesin E family protein [Magnetovibrio blakemorei]OEJ64032.1 hypothetical protein BEN30_01085 [Magnetovibrio blakemorei]